MPQLMTPRLLPFVPGGGDGGPFQVMDLMVIGPFILAWAFVTKTVDGFRVSGLISHSDSIFTGVIRMQAQAYRKSNVGVR
jgi:hypothetical protein